MTEENPINEDVLEHWLMLTLKMEEEGKTLDDFIENLKQKLSVVKAKRFAQVESELGGIGGLKHD